MSATAVASSFAIEAYRLLDLGDAASAIQLASDGVRAFPIYIGGYLALADCYLALGHPEAAAVILDETERRFPDRKAITTRRELVARAYATATRVSQWQTPSPGNAPESEESNESVPVDATIGERTEEQPFNDLPEEPAPVVSSSAPSLPDVSPLRIIDLAPPLADTRTIRSASMRLIPGLEYTSLRFEGTKRRGGRAIQHIPEPPSFREFHEPRVPPTSVKRPDANAALERLAERISRVRITPDDLESRPPAPAPAPSRLPLVQSETLVSIYMKQEKWDEAIASLQALIAAHPDRAASLQSMLDECLKRRS